MFRWSLPVCTGTLCTRWGWVLGSKKKKNAYQNLPLGAASGVTTRTHGPLGPTHPLLGGRVGKGKFGPRATVKSVRSGANGQSPLSHPYSPPAQYPMVNAGDQDPRQGPSDGERLPARGGRTRPPKSKTGTARVYSGASPTPTHSSHQPTAHSRRLVTHTSR